MKAIIPFLLLAFAATANAQISMGINRVVYVAASRDLQAGCAGLRSVLDSIEGPFADYRIILEPGVYDCGQDTLVVPDFTVLESSGRLSTEIAGNSGTPTGVITLGHRSELRNLTVNNFGGGTRAVAISTGMTTPNAHTIITGVAAFAGPASSASPVLNVGPNTFNLRVKDSLMLGENVGAVINTTGFVSFEYSAVYDVSVITGNPICIYSYGDFFLNTNCTSTAAARAEGQEAQAPFRRPPIPSYPEREKQ